MRMLYTALQKNTEKASESTNEAQESKLCGCLIYISPQIFQQMRGIIPYWWAIWGDPSSGTCGFESSSNNLPSQCFSMGCTAKTAAAPMVGTVKQLGQRRRQLFKRHPTPVGCLLNSCDWKRRSMFPSSTSATVTPDTKALVGNHLFFVEVYLPVSQYPKKLIPQLLKPKRLFNTAFAFNIPSSWCLTWFFGL